MRYTAARSDTFETIQLNAGLILTAFDPTTGSYNKSDILCATSGGISISTNPEWTDFGEDIDNIPGKTKQLKRLKSVSPKLSATAVTMTPSFAKLMIGAATVDSENTAHIIPSGTLDSDAFPDLWAVGDFSDKNGNTNGGRIAYHFKNALSTSGFQWKTTKDGKGTFPIEFESHYDIENVEELPYEVYVNYGSVETITITSQPADTTKTVGSTASFMVAATASTGTLTYQWQAKAASEAGYTDISGETSTTLSLSASEVIADNSGTQYRCKVSNGTDTMYSKSAILTVTAGA